MVSYHFDSTDWAVPNRILYFPATDLPRLDNVDLAVFLHQYHDRRVDGDRVPGVSIVTRVPNSLVVVTLVSALNAHGQIKDHAVEEDETLANDTPVQFVCVPYIARSLAHEELKRLMYQNTIQRRKLVPSPCKTGQTHLKQIAKSVGFEGIKCNDCHVAHCTITHNIDDRRSDYIIPWIKALAAHVAGRSGETEQYICTACQTKRSCEAATRVKTTASSSRCAVQ